MGAATRLPGSSLRPRAHRDDLQRRSVRPPPATRVRDSVSGAGRVPGLVPRYPDQRAADAERLEDVYWSEAGRSSLDAVLVATAFAALIVVGSNPLGLDDPASISGTAAAVTVILGLAVVRFLKGRVLLGVIGVFVPVVALVGAVRLADPSSPWARWRYRGPRLEQARARFNPSRRAGRWQRRIADLVAGAPED